MTPVRMEDQLGEAWAEIARQGADLERLRERCEAYKGQVKAGAAEIERLRAALTQIKSIVAPGDGFSQTWMIADAALNQQTGEST